MRVMRALILGIVGSTLLGCAKPISLQVETVGVEGAAMRTSLVRGARSTVPSECATPCTIEVEPDTAHELRLEAPGHYPASFEISHEDLRKLTAGALGAESVLHVPLIRRSPEGETR